MMEKILSKANLSRAARKVRKNNGAAGVDGMKTKELFRYMEDNSGKIKARILNGTYRPSPVLRVEIPKDDGKKRKLGIPTVLDRVIQQAIMQTLQPVYEPRFSDASYGFRSKRNAHGAVLKCRSYVNAGYVWAVDLDIEQFFDTVDRRKIMRVLSETVRDERLLSLIRKFMRAGALWHGKFEKTPKGLSQGGPLSPILANILLDRLDKELERAGKKFVRYADDMVILCRSKTEAKHILRHVSDFLENDLRLKLNRKKTAVVYANKIQFLGFGFCKHGNEFRLRIHPKALKRMKARIGDLMREREGETSREWKRRLKAYIRGWVNYYKPADPGNAVKAADEYMQRQLRLRLRTIWEQAVAELRSENGDEAGRAAREKIAAFLPRGTSPVVCPPLSKRQLESDGFPYFSAHFAAIAG